MNEGRARELAQITVDAAAEFLSATTVPSGSRLPPITRDQPEQELENCALRVLHQHAARAAVVLRQRLDGAAPDALRSIRSGIFCTESDAKGWPEALSEARLGAADASLEREEDDE